MSLFYGHTKNIPIILKFFIYKLDASLQITVHGQNLFLVENEKN